MAAAPLAKRVTSAGAESCAAVLRRLALDAFGDNGQAELVREVDDDLDNDLAAVVPRHLHDEALVDLPFGGHEENIVEFVENGLTII